MPITLSLTDAAITGKVLSRVSVHFDHERITIADLITKRVYAEVEKYNATLPEYFMGLVQPRDAESVLNGYKLKSRRKVDAEQQSYFALDAFQKNAFFILVNDRQVSELEEEITLTKDTNISFVKLTPLVGG